MALWYNYGQAAIEKTDILPIAGKPEIAWDALSIQDIYYLLRFCDYAAIDEDDAQITTIIENCYDSDECYYKYINTDDNNQSGDGSLID